MAFPSQKQESFLAGHVAAFHFLGGIPQRLTYDNLKAAVKKIFIGPERQEQEKFIVFRSHYLFESHYCTPGAGHEKGRVEDGVGYARRNFMSPLLIADSFAQLKRVLHKCKSSARQDRHPLSGQNWLAHLVGIGRQSLQRALPA